jgi:hypothetical protein
MRKYMYGRWKNRLNVVFSALLALPILGCAREPSLRSIAYREFGPGAIVVTPQLSPPSRRSPEYASNDFRYVPGTFASPKIVNFGRDDLSRRAEVWTIPQGKYCEQRLFRLHQTVIAHRPDIVDDYKLDATFPLDIAALLERASVRQTYSNLSDGEFGKLKRVTITLKRVRWYSLTDDDLTRSFNQIKNTKCFADIMKQQRVVQVAKVIFADLNVKRESARGIRLALGPIEGHAVESSTFIRNGKYLMIAILPR